MRRGAVYKIKTKFKFGSTRQSTHSTSSECGLHVKIGNDLHTHTHTPAKISIKILLSHYQDLVCPCCNFLKINLTSIIQNLPLIFFSILKLTKDKEKKIKITSKGAKGGKRKETYIKHDNNLNDSHNLKEITVSPKCHNL